MEGLPTITIMGYQALLFCADEKAIRVVSQVLADLDFHVEHSAEPFSSVKRLTTEHFDALVVDCDDEQNAALLFKTARNSEHNNASLAVALVQGQGGIAKAFKIGANLILTKPINAEQSKGTLRVARGMLRKAEAGKAAAAAAASSAGQTRSLPATESVSLASAANSEAPATPATQSSSAPLIEASSAEISAVLETKKEPLGLLTSGETDLSGTTQASELANAEAKVKEDSSDSGKYSWQSKGGKSTETGATPAAETAQKAEGKSQPSTAASKATTVEAKESTPDTKSSDSGTRTGAAAARAKESPAPEGESSSKAAAAPAGTPKKTEPSTAATSTKKDAGKIDTSKLTAPSFSWSEAARDHEATGSSENKRNFLIAAALVLALAAGAYYAWPRLEPVLMNIPVVQKYLGTESRPAPAPAPAAVRQTPSDSTQPATTTSQTSAAGPGITPSSATAPAESANTTTAATEASAPAPLAITQSVSEQLLVKKTQPVYPAAGRQKKLAGDVQLQATVGKDGAVTQIKVLNGDEVLAHAATDAVRQWKYKPYVLNGQPTEFETPVTVNFKSPN
jgi:protein TonB